MIVKLKMLNVSIMNALDELAELFCFISWVAVICMREREEGLRYNAGHSRGVM